MVCNTHEGQNVKVINKSAVLFFLLATGMHRQDMALQLYVM